MVSKKNSNFVGWGIVWRFITANKKEFHVLVWLGVFSALANGAVPYIAGRFFDAIISRGFITILEYSVPLWEFMLGVWGLIQITALIADWMWDIRNEELGSRLYLEYKSQAFSHLLFYPLTFHKERKFGEIMEAINRAGNDLYSIVSHIVVDVAPKLLSIIVGFGFAFFMNIPLALVLLAGVLLYVLTLIRMVPQAMPIQHKMFKSWQKAHEAAHEAVHDVLTVKQFVGELFEKKKIRSKFDIATKVDLSIRRIWTNIRFSSRAIIFGSQLAIFTLSVIMIHQGILSLGQLLAFNGYAAMVFGPFVVLGQNWQTLQNGLVSLDQTEAILSLPTEEYEPKDAIAPKEIKGEIEFKNVSFAYKKGNAVLRNVNFKTKSGEMVALVGESGAGKSTLIDLISGYYFPANGSVSVDGVPTAKWNLRDLRNMIAIVPQEVSLFNETIEKNLAYGPRTYKKTVIMKAAKVAHVDTFVDKFPKKYQTIVGNRGVKLSVGQKQRVAIARAILRDPKILILDEPTSALDSETEKYVTEALNEVMKGRTTFVVAHRLSTVRKADKILVLENGEIVESGTHDELMKIKNGNYRRRYELHIGLE